MLQRQGQLQLWQRTFHRLGRSNARLGNRHVHLKKTATRTTRTTSEQKKVQIVVDNDNCSTTVGNANAFLSIYPSWYIVVVKKKVLKFSTNQPTNQQRPLSMWFLL